MDALSETLEDIIVQTASTLFKYVYACLKKFAWTCAFQAEAGYCVFLDLRGVHNNNEHLKQSVPASMIYSHSKSAKSVQFSLRYFGGISYINRNCSFRIKNKDNDQEPT